MSEEREGAPQELASMFGAVRDDQKAGPPEPEQPKDDPSTSTPTEADRVQAAKLLGMHPDLAPLLKGKTIEELVGDAAELAKTLEDLHLKREQAKPVSFDGGVREQTPGPSDPEAEHNAFLLDIFGKPGGTGGW